MSSSQQTTATSQDIDSDIENSIDSRTETDIVPPIEAGAHLDDDDRRRVFDFMLQTREFDLAMLRLYRQGRAFGGVYSQMGNEATAVATAYALQEQDVLFPMHRDIGAHFVRGQSLHALMLNHLARKGSMMRGTDGTGHYADPDKRIYGNISHLGAMIPVAAGFLMASRLKGEDCVAMTYIGDGGSQIGDFHEAMNLAAVQNLPLIVIIENNQYAYSTPNSESFACERLSDRALGYGCHGVTVDGTNPEAVYDACFEAIRNARGGGGPALIETVSMRMRGHAEHDDFSYVPREVIEYWARRDPVDRYEKLVLERKIMTADEIAARRKEISSQMNSVIDEVVEMPFPDAEEGFKNIFMD